MLGKPTHLEPGDTIGVVSPASAPPNPQAIDDSVAAILRLGFKAKLGRNVRQRAGFLAGADRERASDLMAMFLDRRVKAIVCVRGGYGSARLLELLDYSLLRSHPKILVGYSDITALHCALLTRANLISFHGPMLKSDLIKQDLPDFTWQGLVRTLTRSAPPGSICQGYRKQTVSVLRPGRVSGRLMGGNLSILCGSLATPFQPSFKRKILFFEEVNEVPYRIDRMLTQLLNAGLLQQVAGIAIGLNRNCKDPKAATAKEYRQSSADVFAERLLPLKVPIVSGLPFGHVSHNATLPVGGRATLDGDLGDLVITEAVVS